MTKKYDCPVNYDPGIAVSTCKKCVLIDGEPVNIIVGIMSHGGTAWVKNADTNEFLLKDVATNEVCPVPPVEVVQPVEVIITNPADITGVIVGAIDAQTIALTAQLQAICDKFDAGLTVNAVQSGEWVVSVNAAQLQSLIDAIIAANAEISIDNFDELVALLEASEDINVTVDGGNITVDGEVSIDGWQDLLDGIANVVSTLENGIDINSIPDINLTSEAIANLEGSFTNALENADITVTVGGQDQVLDVNITNDTLTVSFDELIGALQETVRKDFEPMTGFCINDAEGNEIPNTGVFTERCYDYFGNLISSTLVFSILNNGEWEEYTLVEGQEFGRCDPVTTEFVGCWKDKFIEGGLDNTGTNFRHTSQVFNVSFSDGTSGTFNIASATGWSDQVTQMANGLKGLMPWAQIVAPFCTTGCGGLPEPAVSLSDMILRYVGFRVCPSDVVPVSVKYTSDQQGKPRELVLQYIETPTIYIDRCFDCEDGTKAWKRVDTGADYEPVCAIPCCESFPAVPLTSCSFDTETGCDNVGSTNSEDWVNLTRITSICDGQREVNYFIEVEGVLEDYNEANGVVGQFVDCVSGVSIPETPVEYTLSDFMVLCESPCKAGAIRLTAGRPGEGSWEYAGVSGASIQEFEAAWVAQGGKAYITNQNGTGDGTGSIEAHWICPLVDGAVLLFNGEPIEENVTLVPNTNPIIAEQCPDQKSLATKGCNDDRRDNYLAQIASLEVIESRPICVDHDGDILDAFAIVRVSADATTLIRIEDGCGVVLEGAKKADCCDEAMGKIVKGKGTDNITVVGDFTGLTTIDVVEPDGAVAIKNVTGSVSLSPTRSLLTLSEPVTATAKFVRRVVEVEK